MEGPEEQLCEAARCGDCDKVRKLVECGGDVSYFDEQGLTPLMHAARAGHAPIVKALLEAGAPWNALSPSNLSAGDFAMDLAHQDAFDLLLNAGPYPSFSLLFLSNSMENEMIFSCFGSRDSSGIGAGNDREGERQRRPRC